jgi:CTP:molybdopterin cytidylyltransferase MocA
MTTVLIFFGAEGPGALEQWVEGGRAAALRDALHNLTRLPAVERVIVAASQPSLAAHAPGFPAAWTADPPGAPFHFGRRLAELMAAHPAPAFVYLSAGGAPLLPVETLAQAMDEVAHALAPRAITNNLYSSDWMVLNCPEAVARLAHRLERDNALGWVLKTEAGVNVTALPPSAASRLDIDTPADLLLLALHPRVGPELAAYLRAHPQSGTRWREAGKVLFTAGSQTALIGRVASGVWSCLEAHTQSWIRVFSEERGMTASGRQSAGRVRSLIADYVERLGPEAFFAELSRMAGAVFFDTRVVLAHQRCWPSAADRYASDLGRADLIHDPFLRAFTDAAARAPIPIVLGGHGVVAGNLYGLVEVAQSEGW